ncbi:hypothetical protein BB404_02025 [Helicobacter pylori]|nr:hypothetical protein BB404_02025 [Helicobacter pylori]
MINKIFYFLKVNLYIYNLKLYLTIFYGSSCTVFVWGENLEHVRVFGSKRVAILKNAVLSLLSYRVKILFKLALSMSD